jgi:4-amino-4-deoxy-L-arabinose transferase-like glycosyltransferase
MATVWLPTALALPWAVPAWARRLRRRDARYLLPLAWWLLVVVFFSIPGGKRDVYILPTLPMMCLALAPLLPGIVRRRGAQWLALAFGGLLALAALAAGVAMLSSMPRFEQTLIVERGLSLAQAHAGAWLLIAIAAWSAASLSWFGRRRAPQALVVLLAGVWVLYGLVAYPLLTDSSSARGLMQQAGDRLPRDAALGLVAWKEQNLLMADRTATTFGFATPWPLQMRRAVAWQQQAPQHRWLMVQGAALPPCVARAQGQVVGLANRREWWLLPASATAACDRAP